MVRQVIIITENITRSFGVMSVPVVFEIYVYIRFTKCYANLPKLQSLPA